MKAPRIIRPEYDLKVGSLGEYFRALAIRIKLFFTFRPCYTVNYMVGENKLGEDKFVVRPRITISLRQDGKDGTKSCI